jgi:Cd2+/Zn2+-exporting ATPase
MVIATAFGAVPLAVGVAAHEGSTLVVCLNSLRLLFGGRVQGGAGSLSGRSESD